MPLRNRAGANQVLCRDKSLDGFWVGMQLLLPRFGQTPGLTVCSCKKVLRELLVTPCTQDPGFGVNSDDGDIRQPALVVAVPDPFGAGCLWSQPTQKLSHSALIPKHPLFSPTAVPRLRGDEPTLLSPLLYPKDQLQPATREEHRRGDVQGFSLVTKTPSRNGSAATKL